MSDPLFKPAIVEQMGEAPFFVFADHASSTIPNDLNNLRLPSRMLENHIAYDIGAKALAYSIGRALGATVVCSNFSRLVADPNRRYDAHDVIPLISDGFVIPANQRLSHAQRADRFDRFYNPYHDCLDRELAALCSTHLNPFVVSVHTFTPKLATTGEKRPWEMGMLWHADERSARSIMQAVGETSGWNVGDNEPYEGKLYSPTIDRHVVPRALRHITIEMRQDMVSDMTGIEFAAKVIVDAIRIAVKHV